MSKELELWQFILDHLKGGESVMLLVVAKSSGSSPGRAGYKMAVAADGELCGSIGGGVMEVNLVEQCRQMLSVPHAEAERAFLVDQVHQKNSPDASGMICSGRQSVILVRLSASDAETIQSIFENMTKQVSGTIMISNLKFQIVGDKTVGSARGFIRASEKDFVYREQFGSADQMFILGGGHCALALSELMARLDFRVSIFDDRPELNTIAKNEFADEITIIDNYETIAEYLPNNDDAYIVVMTLGYTSDKVVIKALSDRDFKYFGVLGSKAKMSSLMKELKSEGIPKEQLARIRTPIGLPINSRTPEEIAVSIAAEIIAVKNGADLTSSRSPREVRST